MMKNLKYYLTIGAAIFLISSCENDFDPMVYGSFLKEGYFETEDDYVNIAMACYIPFGTHPSYDFKAAGGRYAWFAAAGGVMRLFEGTSDLMAPMTTNGLGSDWLRFSQADFSNCVNYARGASGQNVINHFQTTGEVTRMTYIYGLIKDAPEEMIKPEVRKQLLAEVRLCRGLHMYFAFHVYGPLPFITNEKDVFDDAALYDMRRPKLEDAVKLITDDFEYAVANMPEKENVPEQGRYNRDFARFALMRHCLNEGAYIDGYYQRALDMYDELKGKYSLFSKGTNPYAEQFTSNHKFNEEVIMAVSITPTSTGTWTTGDANLIGMYTIPLDASSEIGDNPELDPHGAGWHQYYNVAVKFYDSFEANDLRAKTILTEYKTRDGFTRTRTDIGSKWSGFILNKFKPEVRSSYQPMDIPMARWADVLLMYAETLIRKNNTVSTEAISAVNEVRNRAGLGNLPSDKTASVNDFLNAILEERGHELFYEGSRKIDLIRFNAYAQKCKAVKGTIPTHQYMPLPNYAVNQAGDHGMELFQTYSRPGWAEDMSKAK